MVKHGDPRMVSWEGLRSLSIMCASLGTYVRLGGPSMGDRDELRVLLFMCCASG